jgi:hypothetical protein
MDRTTADINVLRVPADDGAITRALAALDDKLAAWADAMREAQRRIVKATAGRASAQSASADTPPMHMEVPAGQSEPIDVEDAAAKRQNVASAAVETVFPTVPPPTSVSADTPQTPAEPTNEMDIAAASSLSEADATINEPAASCSPSAGAEEPTASTDIAEDEALLASLDPETAKAIRVMRRMSLEHRSVRDLLNEYEANRPTSPTAGQPKKRSWFSRGR